MFDQLLNTYFINCEVWRVVRDENCTVLPSVHPNCTQSYVIDPKDCSQNVVLFDLVRWDCKILMVSSFDVEKL